MNNKHLIAWVIPLVLVGISCKKQEKLNLETSNEQIEKVDLIGIWTPVKTETSGLTKDGIVTVVDSSENVKSYIPSLSFSRDEMIMGSVKGKYNINVIDQHSFLVIESGGKKQDYEILRKKDLIKLKLQESNSQSTIFHFKRKAE